LVRRSGARRVGTGAWLGRALLAALLLLPLAGGGAAQEGPAPPAPAVPAPSASEVREAEGRLPSDRDWLRDAASRGRLFDRVADRLEAAYHAPERIDWPAWRAEHRPRVAAAGGRPALDAALRRAFAGLGDGHTRWIGRTDGPSRSVPPRDGPPVRLGVRAQPLDGRGLLLIRVHPGGAADRAGLARGDVVVRAGDATLGEPGLGWAMQDRIAAALRRGPAELGIERPGQGRLAVEVAPHPVPDGAEQRPLGHLDPATRVGRVEVPAFVAGSAEALHGEVRRLARDGAHGLVLDLRGNPGGSVVEMGLVLGAFVRGAPLEAWARGRVDWRLEVQRDAGLVARLARRAGPDTGRDLASGRLDAPARWDGPLAVLVDGASESAAEALAAALRRGRGALVVGTATPGNVETVRRLAFPGGNAAWVAVGELRRPGGLALGPVEPDLVARLVPAALARGHDAPLAEAARRLRELPVTPGRFF
jgi:carboxyl-terminal processing protease